MAIRTDSEVDVELKEMKLILEQVKLNQTIFNNTFKTMTPKDRALLITKVEGFHLRIQKFLEKIKIAELVNSGTKFGIENLKQGLISQKQLWKKSVKLLDSLNLTASDSASDSAFNSAAQSSNASMNEADEAIKSYSQALKSLGHSVADEHLVEFKSKLTAAFDQAVAKSGDKDLGIRIDQEDGKIKVRFIPKKTSA